MIIEFKNGNRLEVFEVRDKSGAKTGDLVYDFSQKKFHPVYRLGVGLWEASFIY